MRDSSKRWLARHERDPFVRRARAEHYRSRAVYKLAEIDHRHSLFKKGQAIVDLGAAPGGWTQYVITRCGQGARIVAVDLAPIKPILGVEIIQADIADPALATKIRRVLRRPSNIVLSDLAPSLSGQRTTDQARTENITFAAFELTSEILAPRGSFLIKTRHGSWDQLIVRLKESFAKVRLVKPAASRGASAEIYILAQGFRAI